MLSTCVCPKTVSSLYLLGRPFKIIIDHAPLQWLSAQKMEDLLARWALALQEYEFTIHYRSGQENGNADALSRRTYPDIQLVAATTQTPILTHSLHQQQLTDPVIQQLHTALSQHPHRHVSPQGSKWHQPPSPTTNSCGHSFSLMMELYVVGMLQHHIYLLSLFPLYLPRNV